MRQYRFIWLAVSLALLLPLVAALPRGARAIAAADSAIQITAKPFYDGRYRATSWLPLRITVANGGPDLKATVAVQVASSFETTIDLPRGANKSLVLYIQPTGGFRRTAAVRVLADGKELQKVDVPLTGVPTTSQVIGMVSSQTITVPRPADKPNHKVEVVTVSAADLPERGEGLSLFDVLVVDDAPLPGISAAQQQALADWVRMGGQLIVGGTQLEATLAQLPEPLRLATIGAVAPAAPISLLPELGDVSLPDVRALIGAAQTRTIATAGAASVGVQRALGKGQVTVLGFGLGLAELSRLPAEAAFWTQLVRARSTIPEMMGMQSLEDMQAQQLGFALMTLPVLAIPPLGLLAGLIAIYVVIIGPGLYFLLKKLDRQAWGWVAIPLITVVFSLGAYAYGQRLRGDDIILNQISIVEPTGGRARVRTYAGLFSPSTATYAITSGADALFKPMPAGDMNGLPASSGGRYSQGGGGVSDLEVAQWSMSTFAAEQMIDAVPLAADLTLADGVLRGSVRNTGAAPIRDVALFQNLRFAKVGDLPPGATATVELKLTDAQPVEWGGSVSMLLLRDKWDFNKPIQPPTDIRMQMMVLDAMFSTPYDRPTEPMLLGWLDTAPIPLSVDQGRIHQQQLALITAPATVSFSADKRVVLPRGWLKPMLESSSMSGGPCMTQFGTGWYMDAGVLTNTLQLPPALSAATIEKATLFLQSEGAPADDVSVDVYDWASGEWVTQPNIRNSSVLDAPGRFFSPTGLFRMRLDWQKSGLVGKGGACVTLDLGVEGAQP